MPNNYQLSLKDHIDLRETALVGREHGESLLDKLKKKNVILKTIELEYDQIVVIVPDFIISINKSFFLGFLETRIQELGADNFRQKYVFESNEYIKRKIEKNIDAALYNASQENILGLDNK